MGGMVGTWRGQPEGQSGGTFGAPHGDTEVQEASGGHLKGFMVTKEDLVGQRGPNGPEGAMLGPLHGHHSPTSKSWRNLLVPPWGHILGWFGVSKIYPELQEPPR